MNIKEIYNESERGCGFRKEGGLYLVSGEGAAPCGKLPIPLTVCPCCGAGIKASRGWTWINGKKLAEAVDDVVCPNDYCDSCIINDPPEKLGLIWVGEKYYKTSENFAQEVVKQGVCRRINFVPHEFVLGETWVWLAHRKAILCPKCWGAGKVNGSDKVAECAECGGQGYMPGIFSAFKPERIEYVVTGNETEEELERMEKRGITLVDLVKTDLFDEKEVKSEVR